MKLVIVSLPFLMLFIGCNKNLAQKNATSQSVDAQTNISDALPDSFYEVTWLRAREEEAENGPQIFRPSDYKTFPPSRFRAKYVFHRDGTCEYLYLSPNDRHAMKSGEWTYEKGDKRLVVRDGGEVVCNAVVECGEDRLEFR